MCARALSRLELIRKSPCDLRSSWFSRQALGSTEELFESESSIKEKTAYSEEEGADKGSLAKVQEFFRKNKPRPKPAAPQPKKEWLLRRRPEPEEVTEQPEETPPIGDIDAERKWLNFGEHAPSGRQQLISHTNEFRRMVKDMEIEMDPRNRPRPRLQARSKYIRAFRQETTGNAQQRQNWHQIPQQDQHLSQDWLHPREPCSYPGALDQARGGYVIDGDADGGPSYEGLDQHFQKMSGQQVETAPQSTKQGTMQQAHVQDGFADFMSAMKRNQNQNKDTSPGAVNRGADDFSAMPSASLDSNIQDSITSAQSQRDQAAAEAVYEQLVTEEMYPADQEPKPYDYNPNRPKWLNPPDGESVGAVPQREFNDFDPRRILHDFWNESSTERFEDPGQDPIKPNRHKLYGQEYWVARPMLMEKYDYDEDDKPLEVQDDRHKGLDPEIPRHFVKEDGTMAPLSIPETQEYEDFFHETETNESLNLSKRLFAMSGSYHPYIAKVPLNSQKLRIGGRTIDGYTFPKTEDSSEKKWSVEIEDWLYDTPSEQGTDYTPYTTANIPEELLNATNGGLGPDGYGKFERFIEKAKVALPSRERIEEIKLLEGLTEPRTNTVSVNGLSEKTSRSHFYSQVSDRDLQKIMEAETRYRDMFTNEASDALPDLTLTQQQRLESLKHLNGADGVEARPVNQLLQSPSKSDYDSWLLRELEKYKKKDQKYEDVFSLACHPKMLEIAFTSLRRRRPGSVPKTLESNFFELVVA